MSRQTEFTIPTRAAIVTLRCTGLGWVAISQKLANCSPSGAQSYMLRVLRRANIDASTPPDKLPLKDLLELLKDPSKRGLCRKKRALDQTCAPVAAPVHAQQRAQQQMGRPPQSQIQVPLPQTRMPPRYHTMQRMA
ncbi:hypothetical protein NX059_004200 [Plenodomus lindquistii]|nr:hypothetical protein NX059_004200 [Plenodomus lindquistii]